MKTFEQLNERQQAKAVSNVVRDLMIALRKGSVTLDEQYLVRKAGTTYVRASEVGALAYAIAEDDLYSETDIRQKLNDWRPEYQTRGML